MIINRKTDLLRNLIAKRFGDTIPAGGDEVRVNCPFCILKRYRADSKFKLYINPVKNVYNCFKCNSAGIASELVPQLTSIEIYTEKIIDNDTTPKIEPFPISKPLSALDDNHEAKMYLDNRDFAFLRNSRDIYYCDNYCKNTYSFGPKIIFPIYQLHIYKGFQARSIDGNLPKYITSSHMKKSAILYNFDNAFAQDDYVVITEGIFDALKDPLHAVCLFGKNASEDQVRLLTLGNFKKVFVFLDSDASSEAVSLAKRLSCYYKTYLVKTPYKDLGETPIHEIKNTFINDSYLERVF